MWARRCQMVAAKFATRPVSTAEPIMKYICNQSGTIVLDYEPDLLEWLQAQYPFSQYQVVEVTHDMVS